ncbi:MAG: nitrate reductase [Cellvibrionaceae bacterium]|nr:nitrate reductase [Cellvibrionaceae bacterium]
MNAKINNVNVSKTDIRTTCCYCGVGCGVKACVTNNEITAVKGDVSHPANYGRLCVKGSALHEAHHSVDRLLQPVVNGKETDWQTALSYSAGKFKKIVDQYGPDSVAFYLSGQLLTEDYYVANKLIKGFIGTANIDTNSRLCMASAVLAHKRAFGGDLVPGCYEDLEICDLLILVGSNMAYAHPVTYQRIAKAKQDRPHMKVVVIDPRKTATADIADIHLPLKPGADAFFFNGLLSFLAENNGLDKAFISNYCDNFDSTLAQAQSQVPSVQQAADFCEVLQEDLHRVYQLFLTCTKTVTVFSQGVNQSSSGVDKGSAIINCHLASGKIGKPGAAPFSITGQPNAMGGREVGGLANQLAAHMGYANPAHIDTVEQFWQAPNMARKEGKKAVDMFQAIYDGEIKAVWIMATNPVVSMPDANFARRALQKCEHVVVSECIGNTDTAQQADVLLPASTWGEKYGTVTNSERCISLQKNLVQAPGQAKHDWQIICEFARHLGFGDAFDYTHPVEIFREHAALSGEKNQRSRGFDISYLQDISKEDYENFQPCQWPLNKDMPSGSSRLFQDGYFFTANRRAQFYPVKARLPKTPAASQQVMLNTGRIRDQWHTMSRTGNAAKLLSHVDEPFIEIHPQDATHFSLQEGALAELRNLDSRYIARVKYSNQQRRGEIFAPMHWNERFSSAGRANALISAVADPHSGQPEFKHCPVAIQAYLPRWQGLLYCLEDTALSTEFWVKIPLHKGLKYRIADTANRQDWPAWLKRQYSQIDDWVEFVDSSGHFYRVAGFIAGALSVYFSLQQGCAPQESRWIEQLFTSVCDAKQRIDILAGKEGAAEEDLGGVICSCFQVPEKTIIDAIHSGCDSTVSLGEKLKCGTNCGSCLPEINTLISNNASLQVN